jgi:hypothetical protein
MTRNGAQRVGKASRDVLAILGASPMQVTNTADGPACGALAAAARSTSFRLARERRASSIQTTGCSLHREIEAVPPTRCGS